MVLLFFFLKSFLEFTRKFIWRAQNAGLKSLAFALKPSLVPTVKDVCKGGSGKMKLAAVRRIWTDHGGLDGSTRKNIIF